MTFVKHNQGKHIRAFKDIGPEMERLRLKVPFGEASFGIEI
jgi:hypothetical protein